MLATKYLLPLQNGDHIDMLSELDRGNRIFVVEDLLLWKFVAARLPVNSIFRFAIETGAVNMLQKDLLLK